MSAATNSSITLKSQNASRYVLALDEGTTSCRAIVFSHDGRVVSSAQQEIEQIYPSPGAVEHNPEEIWTKQLAVAREALSRGNLSPDQIAAVGGTNQRETTVLWEKSTCKPI